MITILPIGKKHESWVGEGIERYESRLKKPFDVRMSNFCHIVL
jgi:23S rRNA (pseudouridine1915-N3)-methyltransferase